MICKAARLKVPLEGDLSWGQLPWSNIPSESIRHHMGRKPDHFPLTEVKLAYDDEVIHVIFRVKDRYVRASAECDQERVCGDSCVEFFFTPGSDVSVGYFNLEMNCGGTMLFHFQPEPRNRTSEIPMHECAQIRRAHSLPTRFESEISDPVTWMVTYGIPISLLRRFCPVTMPEPGVKWRANFYKCADDSSHPHWLTWAAVDSPTPNFHRPDSFGELEFQ